MSDCQALDVAVIRVCRRWHQHSGFRAVIVAFDGICWCCIVLVAVGGVGVVDVGVANSFREIESDNSMLALDCVVGHCANSRQLAL